MGRRGEEEEGGCVVRRGEEEEGGCGGRRVCGEEGGGGGRRVCGEEGGGCVGRRRKEGVWGGGGSVHEGRGSETN